VREAARQRQTRSYSKFAAAGERFGKSHRAERHREDQRPAARG